MRSSTKSRDLQFVSHLWSFAILQLELVIEGYYDSSWGSSAWSNTVNTHCREVLHTDDVACAWCSLRFRLLGVNISFLDWGWDLDQYNWTHTVWDNAEGITYTLGFWFSLPFLPFWVIATALWSSSFTALRPVPDSKSFEAAIVSCALPCCISSHPPLTSVPISSPMSHAAIYGIST